jgi:hypothetical protein
VNYQDFDLLIDRAGENLRAQVMNSPAGQATAEFRLPFSEDKLENFLLRLGGRSRRGTTRRVETQEMTAAKAFGAALFSAVFSGDVKACFRSSFDEARRQNAGLRIRLRLADPSVVDLPWEYLYNPAVNRFLALSIHTPLVRYMDLPERIQPIAVTPPIRVLVMISSPTDFPSLDVEAEWTRLNEALADLISKNQIAIERLDDATLDALQRRLRRERYHIFHFIGHGEFDESSQEGVLILEGDRGRGHRVGSQSLGMMLHDHETLRVAILNACEGARTSRTDPFAGSAQSLVQQGIPAVIAMQFEIADDVASRFAHEFYGALADGYPIDASLTEARKSIFAARHEVEWGTPVLYMRAPDGRIFDVDTVAPPKPLTVVESGPQIIDSSTRISQDRITQEVVAAARAAFAGGRRAEAIDMLRRYDPAKDAVAQALRQQTQEQQRIADEEQRQLRTAIQDHLSAANELLKLGNLREAWGRACDAIQLDPSHPQSIALEKRIRQMLDEEVARQQARELEQALRHRAEQTRLAARAEALGQARAEIESSLSAEDVDKAEKQLKAADDSIEPGAEFADLRSRLVEVRRAVRAREDRRADEVIAAAREEFTSAPAKAIERLERFTPAHPRVTVVCRELKQLLTDHHERAARDAQRRADEARERQREDEQRQRDLRQAVQRIDGYLNRDELPEAEAALQASRDAFGTNTGLTELRERLLAAKRKTETEKAVQDVLARARKLAEADDHSAALLLLESFQPPHANVDAALEALRREAETSRRRHDVERRINEAIARAELEPSHRAAIAGLQEVLALDPDNVTLRAAIKRRRRADRGSRLRTAVSAALRSRLTAAAAMLAIVVFVGTKTIPPMLSRLREAPQPAAGTSPPQPQSQSQPTTGVVPPKNPEVKDAAAAAPAPPPPKLTPAPPPVVTPVDNKAELKITVDSARRRAERERARARNRAAGLSAFRSAEDAMARGAELAGQEDYEGAASAYDNATRLFRESIKDADRLAEANPGGGSPEKPNVAPSNPARGNSGNSSASSPPIDKSPEKPGETGSRGNVEPSPVEPIPRPPRSDPPKVTPPPPPVRPTAQSALEAYERALSRRDENALRAVYPGVPREVIESWSKKDSGVKYTGTQIIQTRDELEGPTRVRFECTFFYNFITNAGSPKMARESRLVVVEKRGDNWDVVESRRR